MLGAFRVYSVLSECLWKNFTGDSGGIRTHDLLLTSVDILTPQPPSLPDDYWPTRIPFFFLFFFLWFFFFFFGGGGDFMHWENKKDFRIAMILFIKHLHSQQTQNIYIFQALLSCQWIGKYTFISILNRNVMCIDAIRLVEGCLWKQNKMKYKTCTLYAYKGQKQILGQTIGRALDETKHTHN